MATFGTAEHFLLFLTGKSCGKQRKRGSRETHHQNDSGSPYTNMQPAPMHSTTHRNGVTAAYAMVYSLAQRRNTTLCPGPPVAQSKRFATSCREEKATSKNHQKSACCVTALLTGKGRRGTKRNARRKQGRRHRGMLHSRTLHHCFLHV